MSHVGMPFVNVFGESLELFRKVLKGDNDTRPFVVAGSGTLGWDMVASNLCEKGDNALVLHTGYNYFIFFIFDGVGTSAIHLQSVLKSTVQMQLSSKLQLVVVRLCLRSKKLSRARNTKSSQSPT